jgi:hypothetical protein
VKDESLELIRHLAAECGVAVDRSDPVILVQVATQLIVRKALEASEKASAEQLQLHRQALEAIAAKWNTDAKHAAAIVTKDAAQAIAAAVSREHGAAFRIASEHFAKALQHQETALRKSRWVAITAAALAIGAAVSALWAA